MCKTCERKEIENRFHMIFSCDKYDNISKKAFNALLTEELPLFYEDPLFCLQPLFQILFNPPQSFQPLELNCSFYFLVCLAE